MQGNAQAGYQANQALYQNYNTARTDLNAGAYASGTYGYNAGYNTGYNTGYGANYGYGSAAYSAGNIGAGISIGGSIGIGF